MDNKDNGAHIKFKKKSEDENKGPWWYWLLIYLAVAAIVYGAIYFLVIKNSGAGTIRYGY